MHRTTPLRNPRTSTSDLLTWSEQPPPESSVSGHRSRQVINSFCRKFYLNIALVGSIHSLVKMYNELFACSSNRSSYSQPSDKIGEVLRGSQLTEEETKRKPCSGYKMKEMTGSGIFSGNAQGTTSEANSTNSKNRTSIRVYQQGTNGISQISFSTKEIISPKKPTSIPEIAKQRELSGTYQSESNTKTMKQISSAKTKELIGSDIFGPPPAIVPRSLAVAHTLEPKASKDTREPVPRKVRASVQVSNRATGQRNMLLNGEPIKKTMRKIHDQKLADLTGNNIFKGDVPAGSPEKTLSRAKLREMAGSDIFADGKTKTRDYLRGARKPPGGGSSIALL
ncbi:hypothetical protein CR513_46844, partial [Mucuna pruriens]